MESVKQHGFGQKVIRSTGTKWNLELVFPGLEASGLFLILCNRCANRHALRARAGSSALKTQPFSSLSFFLYSGYSAAASQPSSSVGHFFSHRPERFSNLSNHPILAMNVTMFGPGRNLNLHFCGAHWQRMHTRGGLFRFLCVRSHTCQSFSIVSVLIFQARNDFLNDSDVPLDILALIAFSFFFTVQIIHLLTPPKHPTEVSVSPLSSISRTFILFATDITFLALIALLAFL